jgi:hypothetical protein
MGAGRRLYTLPGNFGRGATTLFSTIWIFFCKNASDLDHIGEFAGRVE